MVVVIVVVAALVVEVVVFVGEDAGGGDSCGGGGNRFSASAIRVAQPSSLLNRSRVFLCPGAWFLGVAGARVVLLGKYFYLHLLQIPLLIKSFHLLDLSVLYELLQSQHQHISLDSQQPYRQQGQ